MDLASFGSNFVSSSGFLCRFGAISYWSMRFSMIFIPGVGVELLHFSSWWQVDEKSIQSELDELVSCSEQFPFLIFLFIWSEWDEQVLLVLQGSSSHWMFFSAYGAIYMVTWVTLDVIFQEVCEAVVMRLLMVFLYDLYCHSIIYVMNFLVCLVCSSLSVFSFDGI